MLLTRFFSRTRRRWAALAGFHLFLSLAIGAIGLSSWLSSLHNDRGIWNFASDSNLYESQVIQLSQILQHDGWHAWLSTPSWLHVKLYSLPYRFLGESILSVICVNTPVYLLTLWLVYRLGKLLFHDAAGWTALLTVALLPSFLVQSTQLLRDSLLYPAQLAFLYGMLALYRGEDTWHHKTKAALWAIGGFAVIWSLKNYLAGYYLLLEGIFLFAGLALWIKLRLPNNRALLMSCLIMGLSITLSRNSHWFQFHLYSSSTQKDLRDRPNSSRATPLRPSLVASPQAVTRESSPFSMEPSVRMDDPAATGNFATASRLVVVFNKKVKELGRLRDNYRLGYPEAGSNIDTEIAIDTFSELLRYLPRALLIGVAAPFPSMWLGEGRQTGRIGRMLAGFEMLFMYMIMWLALRSFWEERFNPLIYPFGLFIVSGLIMNALIITNIGCLYRFRYIYWFLLIIFAARGAPFAFRPPLRPLNTADGVRP